MDNPHDDTEEAPVEPTPQDDSTQIWEMTFLRFGRYQLAPACPPLAAADASVSACGILHPPEENSFFLKVHHVAATSQPTNYSVRWYEEAAL